MTTRLAVYALRSLRHRSARSLAQVLAIAAALALLGSILLFVSGNLGLMTRSAAAGVPLDWQAAVPDASTATALAGKLRAVQGVVEAAPAATATITGARHDLSGSVATAGGGSMLAVPVDYLGALRPFHLLTGRLDPSGVVLSQPLASTLQAQVGDTVTLDLAPQLAPQSVRVTGIAVIDVSDLIFQPLGASAAGAPAAPPTQVVIAPIGLFQERLTAASTVQWQVHAQVDRALLTGGPAEAQQHLATFRHVVERTFPGELSVADNLDAALGVAAQQALYGQAIFIFLGLPGVLIALWLAYYAAAAGAADERRDIALLRTRGASRPDVTGAAVVQGLVVGAGATLIGIVGALVALRLTGILASQASALDLLRTALVILFVGLAAGVLARLGIMMSAYHTVVAAARAREPRAGRPLWARLYLDVLALVISAVVFGIDRVTGLSAVVNPDTNPTLALSLYSFLAPTLLWIGVTLLLVRVGSTILKRTARRMPAGQGSKTLLPFLVQSAGRRAPAISRAMILVGLLLSFGVSLGLFSATYDQQSLADARLTLGSDVVVTAPPNGQLSPSTLNTVAATAGVRSTSAMRHTFAYVGPDLQDLYAINPSRIGSATQLRDSYFTGASAAATLEALRARPDGVLVSAETIKDYGLGVGDLVRLRLLDAATSQYRVIDFHVVGVVKEFPTAPKDSFLVANLPYVLSVTHAAGPNVDLVSTSGDPHVTAMAIQGATAGAGATTGDITSQLATTSSSLTAISLAGISRLEEAFAVVLALGAVVLFGTLAVIERRREFATMAAMGARLRTVASFLWTETTVVAAMASLLAAALGTVLSLMLVTILTHVFDPPPDALAVPWRFLGLLGVAIVLGALASAALALVALRRADLSTALRES
jgi:putative ABC transport system permease protein